MLKRLPPPDRKADNAERTEYLTHLLSIGEPTHEVLSTAMRCWQCTEVQARQLLANALIRFVKSELDMPVQQQQALIVAQLRTLQRMCLEEGDTKSAVSALREIARVLGVSAPQRNETTIHVRGGKMSEDSAEAIRTRIKELVNSDPEK